MKQVNQDPIGTTKSHQSRSDKAVGLKHMTMTTTYMGIGVPKHGIRTNVRYRVFMTMTFLAGDATVKAERNPGQ